MQKPLDALFYYRNFFIIFMLAMASSLQAQNSPAQKVLTDRFAALQKLDKAQIASFYAPNATVVVSGELFENIEAYLNKQLPEFEGSGVVFSNHQVSHQKSTANWAIAAETYDYSFKKSGKEIKGSGTATYTLQKIAGKWLIVQFHVSFKRQ